MQAKGKEIEMAFDGRGLVGFKKAGVTSNDFIIDPAELHKMIVLVQARQPQFGGKVLHDGNENPVLQSTSYYADTYQYYIVMLKFFEAIIRISERTYISEYYAAGFGMGEYGRTADGSYLLDSPFDVLQVQNGGKLFFSPHHFKIINLLFQVLISITNLRSKV